MQLIFLFGEHLKWKMLKIKSGKNNLFFPLFYDSMNLFTPGYTP
jgi:hypothetical protein